jgi:hypothetical protein
MNPKARAKHYGELTPKERFSLIPAASDRGDATELDWLTAAASRTGLSMADHTPYTSVVIDLGERIFMELVEEAASYCEAFERAHDILDPYGSSETDEDDGGGKEPPDAESDADPKEGDACAWSVWEQMLDVALMHGFHLRTKADGWELFCQRLNVPPFVLWKRYPGFERLERALTLAEKAAFTRDGFLHWLNTVRPAGEPEATEVRFTPESVADDIAIVFQKLVDQWSV